MSTQAVQINTLQPSRALNIAFWIVQVATAGMFFMAGGSKLAGAPQMVGLFQAIGIGQWFRYLTGALEITGGLLLLVPALSGLGGLLLTGVMLGAVATHLFVLGGNPAMAITLLVASALVAWGRKERTLALIGR